MNSSDTPSATVPPASSAHPGLRRFTYGRPTQLLIGFTAAFILSLSVLMPLLPTIAGAANHDADWFLLIPAAIMLVIGAFMVFGLIAIVRTDIRIDGTRLDAIVPDGHTWYLAPHFRAIRLPIGEIRSVERRTELFKSVGVPNMRRGLSIVTMSGERIGLVSSTPSTVSLDVDDVADAIANAAGVAVIDDGTVRTKSGGLYGSESSSWIEPQLGVETARKAQRTVTMYVQIVTILMMLTFVLRACT